MAHVKVWLSSSRQRQALKLFSIFNYFINVLAHENKLADIDGTVMQCLLQFKLIFEAVDSYSSNSTDAS